MATHHPFPWTLEKAPHGTFLKSGNYCIHRVGPTSADQADAELMTTIPGLLMAAMRGHGWGDPLHKWHKPNCIMCQAIRKAIGPLTRERVIELAKMDPDHVSEMIFEDRWDDVWIHLGLAPDQDGVMLDPDTDRRARDGEYEMLDVELVQILPAL